MVVEILGIQVIHPESVMAIISIAIGISLFSAFVHKKLVDRRKMDEIRKRIEDHQKRYLKAQKEGDQKKIAQLEREQTEIMGLVKKNFMMSMKPVFITMPIFLVVLWWMGQTFGKMGPMLDLPFPIPLLTYSVEELGVVNGISWIGLYMIVAIPTSLIIEFILKKWKK